MLQIEIKKVEPDPEDCTGTMESSDHPHPDRENCKANKRKKSKSWLECRNQPGTDVKYDPNVAQSNGPKDIESGSTHKDCSAKSRASGFICDKCGVSVSASRNLLTHHCTYTLINRHTRKPDEEKTALCTESGKQTNSSSTSQTHHMANTKEKYFPCPECGKTFTGRSSLNKHFIIHSKEKPFKCSECGKPFLRKASLVEHERIHTGEKPFTCTKCGKCFSRRGGLYKHQVICNEEKPFACTECGKRFSQKTLFLIHQNSHAPPCPDCGKTFDKKSNFLKHIKIHGKDTPSTTQFLP